MKFAQNIDTKKLSFDEVEKEQNAMLIKIEELEQRANSKSSRLKDEKRKKKKKIVPKIQEIFIILKTK